jgi:hypothetical protein
MAAALGRATMGCMESVLDALPQRLRALGWACLLTVVMLVGVACWGARP